MKTLKEHNAERSRFFTLSQDMKKPHPNGISCPECGGEMWDSNPMMMLTSNPPQKNVDCPSCGYRGYRIA